jgi:hypothetical protein
MEMLFNEERYTPGSGPLIVKTKGVRAPLLLPPNGSLVFVT